MCIHFEMQAAVWNVFFLPWDRADCAHLSPYVYNLLYSYPYPYTCTGRMEERVWAVSTCDICLILLVVDCIKVLSSDNNSKNKVNFNTGTLEHFYGLRKQFVWYKVQLHRSLFANNINVCSIKTVVTSTLKIYSRSWSHSSLYAIVCIWHKIHTYTHILTQWHLPNIFETLSLVSEKLLVKVLCARKIEKIINKTNLLAYWNCINV